MKSIVAVPILIAVHLSANAEKLKHAYLDSSEYVHVVTGAGIDTKLVSQGRATRLALANNKKVAAWLAQDDVIIEGQVEPASNTLFLYRNGVVKSIICEQLIRHYWFVKEGKRIAIDCGPRYFAGREILYDVSTMAIVDSFEQAEVPVESRPDWADGGLK